jgi:hypothetical protein
MIFNPIVVNGGDSGHALPEGYPSESILSIVYGDDSHALDVADVLSKVPDGNLEAVYSLWFNVLSPLAASDIAGCEVCGYADIDHGYVIDCGALLPSSIADRIDIDLDGNKIISDAGIFADGQAYLVQIIYW